MLEPVRQLAPDQVEIRTRCTDQELEGMFASATVVIQPSLDEGFGLPVAEALDAGIPVCCSAIGALEEAADGAAELFEPRSVQDIRRAIDQAVADARAGRVPTGRPRPSVRQFAEEVLSALERI
jgi:glycosyltransferase involved in cell wall biosynthesis